MIRSPRYKLYELYAKSQLCAKCNEWMNIHDLEVDNISCDCLICYLCLETKKNLLSDYDRKQSLIDIDLRPMSELDLRPLSKLVAPTRQISNVNDVAFAGPLIVLPDLSYAEEANEQCEDESDIDPEERIRSSWHHRALLGDEHRELYDDGQDTDFEAVQAYWDEKHSNEVEDDECQNSHILGLDFI